MIIYNLFWFLIPQLVSSVPGGFVEEGVASLTATTGAFAPNPRNDNHPMLFLASKEGKVFVLEDPDNSDDNFLILNMEEKLCINGERGLQSIRPHPLFGIQNYFVYFYYTSHRKGCLEDVIEGPSNRLVRMEMDPQTFKFGPEEVLIETSPLPKRINNGGSVTFGNDGKLYVTTGDGGSSSLMYSQQLYNLHGKILRLNDDGSIPENNPFVNSSSFNATACGNLREVTSSDQVCAEIFSIGMQNPFRLAMNPNNVGEVEFRVGDVGGATWEEISNGGSAYAGHNYGWPLMEGPCAGLLGNCPLQEDFHDPEYYYQHTNNKRGGHIVGNAFVPKGLWPVKYQYLFIDFIFGTIYNLITDTRQECRLECETPVPGYRNETFHQHELMVDMFFGPYKNTQAMYIASRSSTSNTNVFRIRYTGDENRIPIARIHIDMNGEPLSNSDDNSVGYVTIRVGEAVIFDGIESTDEDGDNLTYHWEFKNASDTKSTSREQISTQIFPIEGEYLATLTVTDELGQSDSVSMKIRVGTPPEVNILSPSEGDQFFVGQVLKLRGSGIDSYGNTDLDFFWEVRYHHAEHYRTFLERTQGNGITLPPAPEPEDFLAATNSYLEVILTAVDKSGLSITTSRSVNPLLVNIVIDSSPQGLEVMVDEFPIETPQKITSWQNHELRLNVDDQLPFEFEAWSTGKKRKHSMLVVPQDNNNPSSLTVFFRQVEEEVLLVSEVRSCSPDARCDRCEGHCRSDEDCKGNLRCFKKGGRGFPIPGCIGIDNSQTDWCTLPESTPRPTLPPTPTPTTQPLAPSCTISGLSCNINSECCSNICANKSGLEEIRVCRRTEPDEKLALKLGSGRGGRGNIP